MVKASDKTKDGGAPETADFSRVADALKDMPAVPLHPLMAHPVAAFAAATAIGFGFATQMTSAFFGSLQGAMEASNRLARKPDEAIVEEDAPVEDLPAESPEPVAAVAAPVAAKPVATPKPAAKPSAAKAPAASPVAKAKTAPAVKPAPAAKAAPKSVKTEKAVDKPTAAKAEPAPQAPAKTTMSKARPDDLKKISGIGPKVEQVLNGMGYSRYADIAAWTEADIAKVEETLGFSGRVGRDDWVGQAKTLKGSKG